MRNEKKRDKGKRKTTSWLKRQCARKKSQKENTRNVWETLNNEIGKKVTHKERRRERERETPSIEDPGLDGDDC